MLDRWDIQTSSNRTCVSVGCTSTGVALGGHGGTFHISRKGYFSVRFDLTVRARVEAFVLG